MHTKEVNIEIQSRPLRIAFLVRNRDALLEVVKFYTHLWGGAANYILPIPRNLKEVESLRSALNIIDVDLILYFEEDVANEVQEMLDSCPATKQKIGFSAINEHINGLNLLRLWGGQLSHIGYVLEEKFPNQITNSKFVLIDTSSSEYRFYLALSHGIPTELIRNYFIKRLSAKIINPPETITHLVKSCLLLTKFLSPLHATIIECGQNYNPLNINVNPDVFSIYLDDENSLESVMAFWNKRQIQVSNSLLLPKNAFLRNITTILAVIFEAATPKMIVIYTKGRVEQINRIHKMASDIIHDMGRTTAVLVSYDLSLFDVLPRKLTFAQPLVLSQIRRPDSSIRFHPTIPIGHKGKDALFGYTAKIQYSNGVKMALPSTIISSLLLSNEIERIKNAQNNERGLGSIWLRPLLVRASDNGVSGIIVSNKECRYYEHTSDTIITEHIRKVGIEVKPNKYTRYAQGLVNRLGGIEQALNVIDSEALTVIRALTAERATQSGVLFDQIIAYFQKNGNNDAKRIVTDKLPDLLKHDMVKRGLALTCPTCDLKDWYGLDQIGREIICNGCAGKLDLPLDRGSFSYKANRLLDRFVETGGEAIFATTNILNSLDFTSTIHFGGNLHRLGETKNFSEIDVFWLTNKVFGIVECKSYKRIARKQVFEFKEDLIKLIDDVASQIGALIIFFCVFFHEECDPELYRVGPKLALRAKQKGISLHFIINGQLYPWGESNAVDLRKINLDDLLLKKERKMHPKVVGTYPNHFSFGGIRNIIDDDVAKRWLYDQEKAGA